MKVIVDGIATEYKDEGAGDVLVFLHGWGSSLATFDEIAKELKDKYRVIRLDFPGFGSTEPPRGGWDIEAYSLFVSDFLNKLALEPYALLGHSFGGRVILKGVGQRILNPKKIVLIGSAGVAKRKTFRNYLLNTIAKVGKVLFYIPPLYFFRHKVRKTFYKMIGSDYLSAEALRMKEIFLNAISEDLSSDAEKINLPTLLVWGRDDSETPIYQAHKLNRLIKNSKLEIVENTGHFVHTENSEEVLKHVKEFLA